NRGMTTMNYASWMKEATSDPAFKNFADRPLKDLVIPGSHDAGSYNMWFGTEETKTKGRLMPDLGGWKKIMQKLGISLATAIDNTSKTQERSILQQLEAGSRFLDLRAKKEPGTTDTYWMVHNLNWTNVPLTIALNDVLEFLKAPDSKDEIVIAML